MVSLNIPGSLSNYLSIMGALLLVILFLFSLARSKFLERAKENRIY